ncbi:hypothetical protein EDD85DRAFT_834072 [Armillaria nabsnona]|nr:hypothetical protein EDD85DRAFT_834072 [Armillaria nabsnona]
MSSPLQNNAIGEDEALNDNGTSSDWDYLKKSGDCGAGLCLAYKILESQKNGVLGPVEFVLFEKEGVIHHRHANRYPGCRCTFTIPSRFYSYAGEIKKYFKTFAQKHGIVPFIRLRHKASGSCAVTVEDLDTLQARTETYDVFAPATGVLNNANLSAIAGMDSFPKTPVLHTAEWPANFNWETAFKDERVAVIGVGSSGFQIIGTIAPYCKSVDIYARSKVWIMPTIVSLDSLKDREWKGDNFSYSEEERADLAKDPEKLYSHIKEVFDKMNTRFEAERSNSEMQKMSQNAALEHMRKSLDREDLCRRLTPGAAFMEAPQYTLRGRGGIDLRDVWKQKPKAYMSIALAGFPNMFLMGSGPGIPYANGSILPGMEAQADYVAACLSKMQKQDIKTMEVDGDAQDEYNIQQACIKETVRDLIWSEHCSSWYKGGRVDGEPYALYAGSTLQSKELLSSSR